MIMGCKITSNLHDPDHFLSGCVKLSMKIREDQLSWNCIVHLLGHYSDYYLDSGWYAE